MFLSVLQTTDYSLSLINEFNTINCFLWSKCLPCLPQITTASTYPYLMQGDDIPSQLRPTLVLDVKPNLIIIPLFIGNYLPDLRRFLLVRRKIPVALISMSAFYFEIPRAQLLLPRSSLDERCWLHRQRIPSRRNEIFPQTHQHTIHRRLNYDKFTLEIEVQISNPNLFLKSIYVFAKFQCQI